ncbi:MAG: radical SAM protein [Candidatus Aenigmatarchaeota archaeon]
MEKKILLINPYIGGSNSPIYNRIWPPLSLAYCASILEKNGFDVKILDMNANPIKLKSKVFDSFDKVFMTTSTIDRWQCPHLDIKPFLKLSKAIRESNPNFYVMGSHGTIRPKEILELTQAKAIIMGEPELTILEICNDKAFSKIKGIAYKKANKLIINQGRELLDLDVLPLPAFHLLPMEKYFYEILGDNFTLFEGSRGCPFSCIYCLKVMYGKGYRKKSPENLIKEVKYGIEEFNVKTAYFIDLEFTLNQNLVEKLCDFLIKNKYNFRWTCQTRFDTINRKMLEKMREAGCEIIHLGVETGSPRIMKTIKKNITIAKIKRGMKLIKEADIKSVCFFMFGLPRETKKDMKMTIKLAKELDPTYASFHIATPYPGTEFYEMIKNEIGDEMFPSSYMDEKELKKVVNSAFLSFYLRPHYIFSRLKRGELKLLGKQIKLFLNYLRKVKK